mmetsp:Transcript_11517/g.29144  ORF Transcript_11517/g.29144 Transcript_11517/m.29144 type:complete len:356 (-) Transcript_11517:770-1837(-)
MGEQRRLAPSRSVGLARFSAAGWGQTWPGLAGPGLTPPNLTGPDLAGRPTRACAEPAAIGVPEFTCARANQERERASAQPAPQRGQQLVRVRVPGEERLGRGSHLARRAQIAALVRQQRGVEARLERAARPGPRCAQVGRRLRQVALARLQHREVVPRLPVARLERHRHLEALVRQPEVPNPHPNVRQVVVHVRQHRVLRQRQRVLETPQRHVVLRRIKAAQPEVVPQLRARVALLPGLRRLQQPPVKAQRHLGLVAVKVVRPQARDGLHVARIQLEHRLVLAQRAVQVHQHLVRPRHRHLYRGALREHLQRPRVRVQRILGLVQPKVHLAEVQHRLDRLVRAQRALQLLLGLAV